MNEPFKPIEQSSLLREAVLPVSDTRSSTSVTPQAGCATCGDGGLTGTGADGLAVPAYVYAIGRIVSRFPNLGAEKEFAQATARTETAGKTDRQTLQAVLSSREHRYLVRQMCWVLTMQGLDTYLLLPRDPADIDLLVGAIDPVDQNHIDVVIGIRGPLAHPTMCNGLMVPIVMFDQIYSFEQSTLIKAIPNPKKTAAAQFGQVAEELFNRIMQLSDNSGAADEHRALNYLVMRYPAIYARAADQFALDFSLTGVDVRSALVTGTRKIVDVIFAYTNRNTDFTEKFSVRVDVTEEFPFLVTKLSPYFDRYA